MRPIACKICGNECPIPTKMNGKVVRGSIAWNRKICSIECMRKNLLENARIQSAKKKTQVVKRPCRECKKEVTSTRYSPQNFCGGKAGGCYRKFLSRNRRGKKNPAYRNGYAMEGSRKYTGIHLRACKKYRKAFMQKHGRAFCEICGANEMQTLKFEVHHIYFASKYPKHPHLHDFQNLIHICIGCHNGLHAGNKMKGTFELLEEERGLKKLFKKN